MLPERTQTAISNALDHALRGMMAPSVTHIAPINTIGCFLLKHVTGVNYKPVAGSVAVDTGGGFLTRQASPDRLEEHSYYVWIEAAHEDSTVERVDFGARYWKDWAKDAEVIWSAADPPFYIWNNADAIPESLVAYTPHEDVTQAVREAINAAILDDDSEAAAAWQDVINNAIDNMMKTEAGLEQLIKVGIAVPGED